jgi:hypothetical protein
MRAGIGGIGVGVGVGINSRREASLMASELSQQL